MQKSRLKHDGGKNRMIPTFCPVRPRLLTV